MISGRGVSGGQERREGLFKRVRTERVLAGVSRALVVREQHHRDYVRPGVRVAGAELIDIEMRHLPFGGTPAGCVTPTVTPDAPLFKIAAGLGY